MSRQTPSIELQVFSPAEGTSPQMIMLENVATVDVGYIVEHNKLCTILTKGVYQVMNSVMLQLSSNEGLNLQQLAEIRRLVTSTKRLMRGFSITRPNHQPCTNPEIKAYQSISQIMAEPNKQNEQLQNVANSLGIPLQRVLQDPTTLPNHVRIPDDNMTGLSTMNFVFFRDGSAVCCKEVRLPTTEEAKAYLSA